MFNTAKLAEIIAYIELISKIFELSEIQGKWQNSKVLIMLRITSEQPPPRTFR